MMNDNFVNNKDYNVFFVYDDYSIDKITTELESVSYRLSTTKENKIYLRMLETISDCLNFGNIKYILIELRKSPLGTTNGNNEIYKRKTYEVNFESLSHDVDVRKNNLSRLNICFNVLKFNVDQGRFLVETKSFIRSLKLEGLI